MIKSLFSVLFPANFSNFKTNWKTAFRSNSFKLQTVSTLFVAALIVIFIPQFFNFIQTVSGYTINDFILNKFEAQNVSTLIFLLIYSVCILAVINICITPFLFIKTLQALCLLQLIRIICLYFFSLNPEKTIIPLEDPFLGFFFYYGNIITKDLFFSGHVSIMALLCIAIPFRPLKYFFIMATILVAILILVQHVHYTIDVVAAPFFSFICFHLVSKYNLQKVKI
jgi:hypothetical protein